MQLFPLRKIKLYFLSVKLTILILKVVPFHVQYFFPPCMYPKLDLLLQNDDLLAHSSLRNQNLDN